MAPESRLDGASVGPQATTWAARTGLTLRPRGAAFNGDPRRFSAGAGDMKSRAPSPGVTSFAKRWFVAGRIAHLPSQERQPGAR